MDSEDQKDNEPAGFYKPNGKLHWWERAYNNAYANNSFSAEGETVDTNIVQPNSIRETSLALPTNVI